jgi:hypothetical protein
LLFRKSGYVFVLGNFLSRTGAEVSVNSMRVRKKESICSSINGSHLGSCKAVRFEKSEAMRGIKRAACSIAVEQDTTKSQLKLIKLCVFEGLFSRLVMDWGERKPAEGGCK